MSRSTVARCQCTARGSADGTPTQRHPVAVPLAILSRLAAMAADAGATTLGYTHQWHLPRAAAYRGLLMASVDSPAERTRATAGGWRTFRVGLADEEPSGHEVHCPAVTDGSTCNACRACDGGASPAVPSVFIHAHGAPNKVNAYTRRRRPTPHEDGGYDDWLERTTDAQADQ